MVSERQRSESNQIAGGAAAGDMYTAPPSYEEAKANGGAQNASVNNVSKAAQKALYFLAEVLQFSQFVPTISVDLKQHVSVYPTSSNLEESLFSTSDQLQLKLLNRF